MSKISDSISSPNQTQLFALIPESKRRILIVDDDRIVRRNLQKTLLEVGFQVDVAGDYNEAVALLGKQIYSLAILDITMPDWSGILSERAGIDLVKEVRVLNPQAMVIMLTAGSKDVIAVEAIKLGADEYLVKGNLSNIDFINAVASTILRAEGNTNGHQRSSWQESFANHTKGILDDIIASILVALLFFAFGKVMGLLRGFPSVWFSNPTDSMYLLISLLGIVIFVIGYVLFQKKMREQNSSFHDENHTGANNEK